MKVPLLASLRMVEAGRDETRRQVGMLCEGGGDGEGDELDDEDELEELEDQEVRPRLRWWCEDELGVEMMGGAWTVASPR